jgi:acetone carboxylase gamma subunit
MNCPVCDKSLDKSVVKCTCGYEFPAEIEKDEAEEKPKSKKKG